ncbi:Putative universal stress protein [uncultured bacterium]|nr:Putative universal stress protein [uncultured bacterium]
MAAKFNGKFSRILLPTDFSAPSENAAAYALELAKRDKAVLQIVHVVNINKDIAALFVTSGTEYLVEEAQKSLKKFVSRLKGYKNITTEVLTGVPHQQLLSFAKKNKSDLVVIGSHGKGRIDRFLLGSNTERVLRKAGCPVLVVPPGK